MVKKNWKFGIIGNYKKIIKIWNFGKKTGSLKRIWKFRTKIGNLEKKNWKFGGKKLEIRKKIKNLGKNLEIWKIIGNLKKNLEI